MIHKKGVEQVVSARTAITFFQITGFFFIKVRIECVTKYSNVQHGHILPFCSKTTLRVSVQSYRFSFSLM